MSNNVLLMLNGKSSFYNYWAKFPDWEKLNLKPIFYSINSPDYLEADHKFIVSNSRIKYLRYLKMIFQIRKIIEKYDIKFVHSQFLLHHGIISAINKKTPVLTTLYGSDIYRLSDFSSKLLSPIISKIDLIHAQSLYTLKIFYEKYNFPKEKLYWKRWGINPYFIDDKPVIKENKDIVFLSPRTIKPLYNIITLVKNFIKADIPKSKLILLEGFIDPNSLYYNKVRSIINKSNRKNDIKIITKKLDHHELKEIYRISDFSINIPNTDQVSLSILESMAMGAIPILSNLPVYRDELTYKNAIFQEQGQELSDVLVDAVNFNLSEIRSNCYKFVKDIGGFDRNFTDLYLNVKDKFLI